MPLLLLQLDSVYCITFLLTDQVSIDLGSRDIFVREHLGYGVDVRSSGYLEGRIGVPEAMESNVFVDAGFKNPSLQRSLRHTACQSLEYNPITPCTTQLQGLVADGQQGFRTGLDSPESDAVAKIRRHHNVIPG